MADRGHGALLGDAAQAALLPQALRGGAGPAPEPAGDGGSGSGVHQPRDPAVLSGEHCACGGLAQPGARVWQKKKLALGR